MDHNTNAMVYLDSNATTPLAPEVITSVTKALSEAWGNPSSTYPSGSKAKQLIHQARKDLAKCINAPTESDMIFTSGGTEANNWVIHSAINYHTCTLAGGDSTRNAKPHVVTTTVEHPSILMPLAQLEKLGKIDVTRVGIDKESGNILPSAIAAAISSQTILVTVMMANNETGTILPIKEIGEQVRLKEKEVRHRIFFHTDAAQTIGKVAVDCIDLGVDFLTIVGHKFYGPRIGALYIIGLEKQSDLYTPFIWGGGQERGWRSGTENTPMIVGLGTAAKLAHENIEGYRETMQETREHLKVRLLKTFGSDNLQFNCKSPNQLPNTCNFSFLGKGLEGYKIVRASKGFSCSTGSACHADKCQPSQVLLNFHIQDDVAANALRVSTGRSTTKQDIELVVTELELIVSQLKAAT